MKMATGKSKIMAIVLLLLTGITFYYCDINSNIRQGINVWKALFSGQFMLYDMTEHKISLMGVDISIIFIVFSIICLFAYLHNKPEKQDRGKWYLYLGLCSILSTLVCYRDYPYWLIYVSPFISILIFYKKGKFIAKGSAGDNCVFEFDSWVPYFLLWIICGKLSFAESNLSC